MTKKVLFRSDRTVRNHARRRSQPTISSEAIDARMTELIHPVMVRLVGQFHRLGLRERVLQLPVMTALVLTMIWRQVESVQVLVGLFLRENLFWAEPRRVSQQAMAERLRTFPADLFGELFREMAPRFLARAAERGRPLPEVVVRARRHFSAVLAIDATTLEEVFHKVGAYREDKSTQLGGVITAVLDIVSKQPTALFYEAAPPANAPRFFDRLLSALPESALVVFDLGYISFPFFATLTSRKVSFVTRAKANLASKTVRTVTASPSVRDTVVQVGAKSVPKAEQHLRLIEVLYKGRWFRYLTNVLDPAILSASDVVDLYARRWRIEEAFLQVKRLLGLSYLRIGGENGIMLQVWATCLLYAVLVDLCDAVAEELDLPLDRISLEMVYRSLYFFCSAYQRGQATDPAKYFAAPQQQDLHIVKTIRKNRLREPLDNVPLTTNL